MKRFLLYIILSTPLFAEAQTVPNGNFESWESIFLTENPEFWESGNTDWQTIASKDFDSYEGEFAMRVTAQPVPFGMYGESSTLLETTVVPSALNFYAKSEVNFGTVSVTVAFLYEDNELYTETWFSSESMKEYTFVSIPFDQIEPLITHARITVSSAVGDLIAGSAWISVDAMGFGTPTNIKNREVRHFKLYPNPSNDHIAIESPDGLIGAVVIVDAQGRMVYDEQILQRNAVIDVQNFRKGFYTIYRNGETKTLGKFIVK